MLLSPTHQNLRVSVAAAAAEARSIRISVVVVVIIIIIKEILILSGQSLEIFLIVLIGKNFLIRGIVKTFVDLLGPICDANRGVHKTKTVVLQETLDCNTTKRILKVSDKKTKSAIKEENTNESRRVVVQRMREERKEKVSRHQFEDR